MNAKQFALPTLTLAIALPAFAQDKIMTPPPAPAASAGLLNDFLRNQSPAFTDWDIGGQVRGRFEAKSGSAVAGVSGALDFSRATPDNNYFLLVSAQVSIPAREVS